MNKSCDSLVGQPPAPAPMRPERAFAPDPAAEPAPPGPSHEAHLVLQAFGSPAQLSNLLPQRWVRTHSIEMLGRGLRLRGPQAEAIGAQLCHAADLLSLLGMQGPLATEVLMDTPGGVSMWQALSIRETPDWGRIQGDAAACLQLLQQLKQGRFLLACHLFVRLTPALQCRVLQAMPAFDRCFGQRLANELTAASSLMHLPLSTAQWCELELDRLNCQGLIEGMGSAFRDLCRRAIDQADPSTLALVLKACPAWALRDVLHAVTSLSPLAEWFAASPTLEAAVRQADRRLAPGPSPWLPS